MAVYSVDKLMAQARQLAADYRRATGKTLPVGQEIARHDAARLLQLNLVDEPGAGYDALGYGRLAGQRMQIKGRVIFDETRSGYRVGQLRMQQNWDAVVLVLMDGDFETFEIHHADRAALQAAVNDPGASKRTGRGAVSVARFKNIGELIWSREPGAGDDAVEASA